MKYLIIPFLLLLTPSTPAIAETYNGVQLPANFMIWRGKVYNLDYMANKGVNPIAQPTVQPIPTQPTQSLPQSNEMRDNEQRVNYENARAEIMLEYLRNVQ